MISKKEINELHKLNYSDGGKKWNSLLNCFVKFNERRPKYRILHVFTFVFYRSKLNHGNKSQITKNFNKFN